MKGLFKDDPWTQKFKELLNERNYVAIKSEQMQGLLLVLFTRREHLLHLREVETEYTRTGLGGIWVCREKKNKQQNNIDLFINESHIIIVYFV